MVDFMVVIMGMVVVEVIVLVFGVRMVPVSRVIVMRHRIRMGTGQELRIYVVGPLREKRSRAPLCMFVRGKI